MTVLSADRVCPVSLWFICDFWRKDVVRECSVVEKAAGGTAAS